jgi:hypothetical protein
MKGFLNWLREQLKYHCRSQPLFQHFGQVLRVQRSRVGDFGLWRRTRFEKRQQSGKNEAHRQHAQVHEESKGNENDEYAQSVIIWN